MAKKDMPMKGNMPKGMPPKTMPKGGGSKKGCM